MMEIKDEYPPMYREIEEAVHPPKHAVFCYGNTIYNPAKMEIPTDIIFHESIHAKQQAAYTDPSMWWLKWLHDKDFRLEQELEAYAYQFAWLKPKITNRGQKEALYEIAHALSKDYGLELDIHRTESLLRNRAKGIIL